MGNEISSCGGKLQWRQVVGPQGRKGVRDQPNDLPCDAVVPEDAAGYCECSTGYFYYNSGHEAFTCASVCAGPRPYQLEETNNVASDYLATKLNNDHVKSVARDQRWQRGLVVVLLAVAGFMLLHSPSKKKSARALYEERRAALREAL